MSKLLEDQCPCEITSELCKYPCSDCPCKTWKTKETMTELLTGEFKPEELNEQ